MAVILCKNCGAKVNSEAVDCPSAARTREPERAAHLPGRPLERVRSGDLPPSRPGKTRVVVRLRGGSPMTGAERQP